MINWEIYKSKKFLPIHVRIGIQFRMHDKQVCNVVRMISQQEDQKSEENQNQNDDGGLAKVVKDIGVIGISRVLMSATGIIVLPVLTKTLGAYGYGLWVQVIATFSILFPIISLGLPESMTRFFQAKNIEEIRDDFYSSLTLIMIIAISISLLIYFFRLSLANAIFDGEVMVVKVLAVILFLRSIDHVLLLVFRAFKEMKKYATLNVITKYGEIGLAIALVLLGYGLIGALAALVVLRTIMLFVLGFLVGKKIPIKIPSFSSIKKYLRFGIPMVPSALSKWVIQTSDRYIIGFFLGVTFVGYYSPGYSLGIVIPGLIGSIMSFVLPPTLSSHYEKNNISMINTVLNLCIKYFLIISVPYFIGVIILGQPILQLITTAEIAEEGYPILVLSGIAGIFLTFRKTLGVILFIMKKTKYYSIIFGVSALINFIGNIVLIPIIGIIAAGITTVISFFIALILTLYWTYKVKDFDLNLYKLKSPILKIIFSSIIMGLIVYYLYHFIMINYIILVILGIGIYFSILYFIGGIDKNELEYLKNLM